MERQYVLGSVALFGAACVPHVYTPASSAEFWANDPGPMRQVFVPDYGYVAAAWQVPPESPWSPYAKYTLLSALNDIGTAPQTTPPSPLSPLPDGSPLAQPPLRNVAMPDVSKLLAVNNAFAAAARVAQIGVPDDAMWVVDLRGAASVAFGAMLSQSAPRPLAVIPTFNNWPADNEMIPTEETLAAMISLYPRRLLPEESNARPVFLLDAWRLAYRTEHVDDQTFDNRYYLNQADLPDPVRLREQGIRRVIYVVESLDTVTTEEDDLHTLFTAYQQSGIAVYMVDLASLSGYPSHEQLYDSLAPRLLVIEPRITVLDDPAFFLRARGGFGGIYAHPINSRYGVSTSSFHAYSGHGGGG
jgi:hypothetical protein